MVHRSKKINILNELEKLKSRIFKDEKEIKEKNFPAEVENYFLEREENLKMKIGLLKRYEKTGKLTPKEAKYLLE